MLALDLFYDRQRNRFLASLNGTGDAALPEFPQGDTFRLRIHNAVANADTRAALYADQPWSFTSIRASLSQIIDGPPDNGSYKLQVGDQVTDLITFPASFADAAAIETFKNGVLAKLLALSNVGAGKIVRSDPPNTPTNFCYVTWVDDGDERPISVVANRLAPLVIPSVAVQRGAPGYQQVIKLPVAPLVMVSDFEFEAAAQPTVVSQRTGQAGQNAVQRLQLPNTVGSLQVTYSGTPSSFLAVPAPAAAGISAALNALVPDGATNPSFAVTAVNASTFDIEFAGPLAGAPQDDLVAQIFPAVPPMVAVGDLPLTSPRFERALNGARSVKLQFELVIVDTGGESKIIREITFVNSATDAATEASLEEQGAVFIRDNTIYVDNSTLEPFATVAQGVSYIPAVAVAAGQEVSVTHALNTLYPFVRGMYQIQVDPPEWREMQRPAEYDYFSTDASHVTIVPTGPITSDGSATDKARYKFFIQNPDAVTQVFGTLKTTWDKVLANLPGGMSVAAKFATLDAAIGMLDGALQVPAGNLVGTVSANNIDIEGLGTKLKTSATFLSTLQSLISNVTVINNIGGALFSSPTFATTLQNLFTTNADVLKSLITALLANNDFAVGMRTLILAIIQGTAGAIDGVLYVLPDHDEVFPALLTGDKFAPLPAAQFSPADGGAAETYLYPGAANIGKYFTVGAAGASTLGNRKVFAEGDVIISDGRDWYLAQITGDTYTADEFNRVIFELEVNENQLSNGTQFGLAFTFGLRAMGNCQAYYGFTLQLGHYRDQANDDPLSDLDAFVLQTNLIDLPLDVTNTLVWNTFGYAVRRAAGGALTATKQINLQKGLAATAPTAPRFVLRAVLDRFDVSNVASPAGQILFKTPPGQTGSVITS